MDREEGMLETRHGGDRDTGGQSTGLEKRTYVEFRKREAIPVVETLEYHAIDFRSWEPSSY